MYSDKEDLDVVIMVDLLSIWFYRDSSILQIDLGFVGFSPTKPSPGGPSWPSCINFIST